MWNESIASRGANEIGSCLFKYVCMHVENGKNVFKAFSDSCGGQNRNIKIALLMSFCVSNCGVQLFDLQFMQSGHSILPNDRDFAIIEKKNLNLLSLFIF